MTASPHQIANTRQCPHCHQWITLPYRRTHQAWEAHKRRCALEDRAAEPEPETVKRAALWGGCVETYQTEAELNGFRASQGTLMDVPTPPPPAPSNQGVLL